MQTNDTLDALRAQLETLSEEERSSLAQLTVPRMCEQYNKHVPHPIQQAYLCLNEREVFFGGAGGGGKSDALLMSALQYVDVPGYSALILRRTWPDLVMAGAIMDRARSWLEGTDAKPHEGGRWWTFPSGARLQFGHLLHDNDKYKYASAEYQFIGFDEITQWPLEQTYSFLFSRLRRPRMSCANCGREIIKEGTKLEQSAFIHKPKPGQKVFQPIYGVDVPCRRAVPDKKVLEQYPPASDGTTIFDIPLRMRCAGNPGGPGHQWTKARFIDPRTRKSGTVFLPAFIYDNPSLDEDAYRESLSYLTSLDRQRLEDGDWDVLAAGDTFDRADFIPIEPTKLAGLGKPRRVRAWDMAATEDGGDWLVGALCSDYNGTFVVEHIIRKQLPPNKVQSIIASTASSDGVGVTVVMEQEPGSSGKIVVDNYKRNVLPGYRFESIRHIKNKESRANALASFAKDTSGTNPSGLVRIVPADWNRDMLDEFEIFPRGAHDDQVDAVSMAFNYLYVSGKRRMRIVM